MSSFFFVFFFFFFQAEDGIRDHCVTGVQTCALPIYPYLSVAALLHAARLGVEASMRPPDPQSPGASRSEERRIGKSVDLGGRRIIKKKKKKEKRGNNKESRRQNTQT